MSDNGVRPRFKPGSYDGVIVSVHVSRGADEEIASLFIWIRFDDIPIGPYNRTSYSWTASPHEVLALAGLTFDSSTVETIHHRPDPDIHREYLISPDLIGLPVLGIIDYAETEVHGRRPTLIDVRAIKARGKRSRANQARERTTSRRRRS